MRTSRDVVFDESRPFYLCPTTDASPASLVDPLSFVLFPDAPTASLPIPHSTLPSSMSSPESPMVLDYTVKPSVTQFYSFRGARFSDAPSSSDVLSSDVSSFSFIENVPSSPPVEPSSPTDFSSKNIVSHRLRRPPDCYSHSAFTTTALSEPTSYHEAIFIQNGSTRWLGRLLPLSRVARGILCPIPHVFIRLLVSGSIRLRLALMILLSAIRLVLLLVVFSRSKVVIMMKLLLMLLI
jgi:hypothetical protein